VKLFLIGKWELLRANYWFLPSLMVAGAVVLSLGLIRLDRVTSSDWIETLGWTFSRGPEGSRAVLSTIAASMMTIASVTFSIMIVALQLASSQFGPRLLRNFMRDRGNQIAIGAFLSTFTYCLLVLRTVNGTEKQQFVPHISVTVGLGLALISLGVFIYFIHHSAESIQVETVVTAVSNDLLEAIDRLYPERLGNEPPVEDEVSKNLLPDSFERDARSVSAKNNDYLQAIDVDRLFELAKENDLVIGIPQRPGKFFFVGLELAKAWPADRVDDKLANSIRSAFYFGRRRTIVQDVEFAIEQLVEIAVRALSPGVNDPFTAIICVERLGSALQALKGRSQPSRYRYDDDKKLRVVTDISTVEGIVDACFNQIRQAARSDASVTLRMLEVIAELSQHTNDAQLRSALRQQADAIYRGSQDGLEDPFDLEAAECRYQAILKALA